MNNLLDRIYAEPHAELSGFAFDDAVARVFPDMIRRSVPGYTTIIPMIGIITSQYAQPHTMLYDLGCSLGASTLAMRHGVYQPECRVVGVDNSDAMLERCRKYIEADGSSVPVELLLDDIRSVSVINASVVTLNFTLQFIPLEDRLTLLSQIADGLNTGGALILSEKLVFEVGEQTVLEELHYDFKRANGYSDLEISQKRTALEDYLIPETLTQHRERLLAAGFSRVVLWYQCFNFCSLLAIK
ncbi:MAG: carboxy-S-adenosyl-L-methionine synthase CmoA [Oceanospirillales bacterium LUC14_002_19_P2]|nr:MAG: carboxy-S-adenosyl-L-methionine synthase CmoA [Oceanospirillales bacterium LUC14_002_19_P2]